MEFMPGLPWLSTNVGKNICTKFPLICGDIIHILVSADKEYDNYERYDLFALNVPGLL